jgi:sulfite exporter TauE/SafE
VIEAIAALGSGFAVGLASSLHCAGMCGGIGASIAFLAPDGGAAARLRVLAEAQAGRVAAYVAAGMVVGAFGSAVYGAFDLAAAHAMLRWAAAATLGWVGLTVAGLAPSLAPAGLSRAVGRGWTPVQRALASRGVPLPLLSGLLWGLMPCAMVYAALFLAMVAGSASAGAATMLGFGLGTVPAVTLAALGATQLPRLARDPAARRAAGLAIAALGGASLVAWPAIAALCGLR